MAHLQRLSVPSLLLVFTAVACKGKGDDTGAPAQGPIHDILAVQSEEISTVFTVSWTTDEATTGRVTYGPDGDLRYATRMETEPSTTHQAVLVGFAPESTGSFQIEAGADKSDVQTVETGFVPNTFPSLTATGDPDNGGLFAVSSVLGGAAGAIILDPQGNYVWYHADTSGLFVYRARMSRDGSSILYNAANVSGEPSPDSAIVRVSLDGSQVTTYPVPFLAHDFVELPDGTLAAIVFETREKVLGDKLVEISPDGTVTDVWSTWDCYDPSVTVGDDAADPGWTFANALDYDEASDSYLLSIHNFSSIVKIQRSDGTCPWAFGGAANTFTFAKGDDHFKHEHQFEIKDGHILVFDNDGMGGSTSRVLEYTFDESAQTASQVWSYVSDPPIYNFVLGDVGRQDNGDTMVVWSVAGQMERVTPAGEATWRVNTELSYAFGFTLWGTDPTAL